MSRIGQLPINIPEKVTVDIQQDNVIKIKGPKGELTQKIQKRIKVNVTDNNILVQRTEETKEQKSLHGLYRSLINNMVIGVSKAYKIEQELVGVGYRATLKGQILELGLGYSHHIYIEIPKEIKISALTQKGKNPLITLESCDKQLIGFVAAKIRSLRKPEPYKGKGIRFVGEQIRRKAGKTAKS